MPLSEENKEMKKEYNKKYHEKNREILEHQQKYNEEHKEYKKEQQGKKITCECGKIFTHSGKARHERSLYHQDYINK